jgi:hypothetical protein
MYTLQKINEEMIIMTKPKNIEALNLEEDDEDGFTDGAIGIGKPLMTFSFAPTPQVQALASAAAKPAMISRDNYAPRGLQQSPGRSAFIFLSFYEFFPKQ